MKKGDDRRVNILDTAERIFYEKGYEDTSVQDILDAMGLSKGGFYHHFDSKLTLLSDICAERVGGALKGASESVAKCVGAVAKLNALFLKGGFLNGESVDFVDLFLRVAYSGEGVMLRETMKRAIVCEMLPLLNETIMQGIEEKVFYTRYPEEIGEILLLLFADLLDGVASLIANKSERFSEALAKLEAYRSCAELLLNAPYGSLELFRFDRLAELFAELSDAGRDASEA